jgi:hypothetical protein
VAARKRHPRGETGVKTLPWLAANAGGWWQFRTALERPAETQEAILRRYLATNAATAFGKAHGFSRIRGAREFQDRVPLAGYAAMEPWIGRIAAGEKAVLTRSPVRTLEVTSGSSAAAKRIPYTAAMQAEIRRAIAPWVFDLYQHRPRLALGCAYWSISPLKMDEEGDGGTVKVGFEDDAEYLGGFWKRLVDSTLAVPSAVRLLRDVESFRYATLLFLLRRGDLTLISVWHPSFLTLLMGALPPFWNELLRDVENGTTTAGRKLRPLPRRAAALRRLAPGALTRIWPRLGLISCWGDGHAALHLDEVRRAFSGVEIQPKGLLATEAFVTIPFDGKTPLAIRSHFFEFLPESSIERPRLAHELETGGVYSVVATTGGGLYRYRLEDRVEVTGFAGRTPALRFLGREGHVSDLCGEKLHESFVTGALARAFRRLGAAPRFAMLAPDEDRSGAPRYILYLEVAGEAPPNLATAVEEELLTNPHYRACVALGQLLPAAVFRVEGAAYPRYLQRCRERGQRLGDVKPLALSAASGWSEVFPGSLEPGAAGVGEGGPI